SNPYRQKFTVGHETGHFTNPWHAAEQGRFVCQAQGMITRADNKNDRYQKMESEANQFAAEILMPSNYMRQDLRRLTGLEVDHIVSLAEKYEVSKEAMGRRYIDFQDEPCALVFSRDGKIMHPYKHKNFPSLKVWNGDPAPADSMTARNQTNTDSSSEWIEQDADTWLSSERYEKVYEQVLAQKNGFKITLLTLDDEKDEEEEKIQSSWKPKLYK
ncbi:MAG: ImmA/IrrE family metallo-endopeptidase, partial [Alphaproteobacteria bacterium]|nr:ImmA/IrrE family metallo-endopeptidase [Alphaproteobacteria bacterium]